MYMWKIYYFALYYQHILNPDYLASGYLLETKFLF